MKATILIAIMMSIKMGEERDLFLNSQRKDLSFYMTTRLPVLQLLKVMMIVIPGLSFLGCRLLIMEALKVQSTTQQQSNQDPLLVQKIRKERMRQNCNINM